MLKCNSLHFCGVGFGSYGGLKLKFSRPIHSSGFSCHASDSTVHTSSDIDSKQYKCIEVTLVEQGTVGLIVLNRPEVLNALSEGLMHDLTDALQALDAIQKVCSSRFTSNLFYVIEECCSF